MKWDTEEEAKGHMSCCTLKELSEKIGFLPDIEGNYKDDTDLLDEGANDPTVAPPTGNPDGRKLCIIDFI